MFIFQNLPLEKRMEPKKSRDGVNNYKGDKILCQSRPKQTNDGTREANHVKTASQGDDAYSGPLQLSGSSGFAWAKRRSNDSSLRSRSRSSSKSLIPENLDILHPKNNLEPGVDETGNDQCVNMNSGQESRETIKRSMLKQWSQLESFDASDGYHSQELSMALYQKEENASKRMNPVISQTSTSSTCVICS